MNLLAQEDSKDVEDILKDVEKRLRFETFIHKNLFQAEKYIKKEDWNLGLNISYHFHQNIERVWSYFQNLENLKTNFKLDSLDIKKANKNNNEKNNDFEGIYYDSTFHAKLLKTKNFCELKKVQWIFYFDNDEIFKLKITFYKITEDNSTVIDLKVTYVPKLGKNIIDQIMSEINHFQLFADIETNIQKKFNMIFQYESCIIQGNPDDIWDLLSDNSKLVFIAPNNDCFLPLNINTMKVGEIVEINMKIKESDVKIKVKFDLVRKTIGSKWIFCYTILGGEPFDILKQTLFVQLTRVNELETQVCIFTKIHENINSEMIIYLANKKKYVLNSLKDYFMNFYSYNSVNGYI